MAKRATGKVGFGLSGNDQDRQTPSPKPLRRISKDTAESLELLAAQIAVAEKHLQKMPASCEPGVHVSIADIVGHDDDGYHEIDWFLEFDDGSLSVEKVRCHDDQGYELLETRRIADYPTKIRVSIAARIPDLIRNAKEAEVGIKKLSDSAIADIQKAIEDSMEAYE